MSVISSNLLDDWGSLRQGNYTHGARYDVETNDHTDAAVAVIVQSQSALPDPVPAYMSTFALNGSADASAYCKSIVARRHASKRTKWTVEVEWSVLEGDDPANDVTSQDDPLTVPVKYWLEREEFQEPLTEAWNETALPGIGRSIDTLGPIQNAAGQEPSSAYMRTVRVPVLVAQKNYATLQELITLNRNFDDAISSDVFYGAPAGEAIYRGTEISQPQYAGGTQYYVGTTRVAFREGGWSLPLVNRGWKFLSGGQLQEATTKDADGNQVPVSEPINLELDGSRTPDGQVGTTILYRVNRKVAFSGLGI